MTALKAPKVRTVLIGFVILLLAGLGVVLLIGSIDRSLQRLVDPLELTNRELSTQVFNLLHPTPTVIPDPVTIINEVRAVARLETIHYTVEKVVTVEVGQGALGSLFGDRLLFVAHGYVIAGIDMGKMDPEDLWLEADTLNVRLPPPEVLVYSLDNDKSYVYDRSTGLLSRGYSDLETIARQAAEAEILNAALADGILEQALVNAQVFLVRFFQALGYEQVIFVPPVP